MAHTESHHQRHVGAEPLHMVARHAPVRPRPGARAAAAAAVAAATTTTTTTAATTATAAAASACRVVVVAIPYGGTAPALAHTALDLPRRGAHAPREAGRERRGADRLGAAEARVVGARTLPQKR